MLTLRSKRGYIPIDDAEFLPSEGPEFKLDKFGNYVANSEFMDVTVSYVKDSKTHSVFLHVRPPPKVLFSPPGTIFRCGNNGVFAIPDATEIELFAETFPLPVSGNYGDFKYSVIDNEMRVSCPVPKNVIVKLRKHDGAGMIIMSFVIVFTNLAPVSIQSPLVLNVNASKTVRYLMVDGRAGKSAVLCKDISAILNSSVLKLSGTGEHSIAVVYNDFSVDMYVYKFTEISTVRLIRVHNETLVSWRSIMRVPECAPVNFTTIYSDLHGEAFFDSNGLKLVPNGFIGAWEIPLIAAPYEGTLIKINVVTEEYSPLPEINEFYTIDEIVDLVFDEKYEFATPVRFTVLSGENVISFDYVYCEEKLTLNIKYVGISENFNIIETCVKNTITFSDWNTAIQITGKNRDVRYGESGLEFLSPGTYEFVASSGKHRIIVSDMSSRDLPAITNDVIVLGEIYNTPLETYGNLVTSTVSTGSYVVTSDNPIPFLSGTTYLVPIISECVTFAGATLVYNGAVIRTVVIAGTSTVSVANSSVVINDLSLGENIIILYNNNVVYTDAETLLTSTSSGPFGAIKITSIAIPDATVELTAENLSSATYTEGISIFSDSPGPTVVRNNAIVLTYPTSVNNSGSANYELNLAPSSGLNPLGGAILSATITVAWSFTILTEKTVLGQLPAAILITDILGNKISNDVVSANVPGTYICWFSGTVQKITIISPTSYINVNCEVGKQFSFEAPGVSNFTTQSSPQMPAISIVGGYGSGICTVIGTFTTLVNTMLLKIVCTQLPATISCTATALKNKYIIPSFGTIVNTENCSVTDSNETYVEFLITDASLKTSITFGATVVNIVANSAQNPLFVSSALVGSEHLQSLLNIFSTMNIETVVIDGEMFTNNATSNVPGARNIGQLTIGTESPINAAFKLATRIAPSVPVNRQQFQRSFFYDFQNSLLRYVSYFDESVEIKIIAGNSKNYVTYCGAFEINSSIANLIVENGDTMNFSLNNTKYSIAPPYTNNTKFCVSVEPQNEISIIPSSQFSPTFYAPISMQSLQLVGKYNFVSKLYIFPNTAAIDAFELICYSVRNTIVKLRSIVAIGNVTIMPTITTLAGVKNEVGSGAALKTVYQILPSTLLIPLAGTADIEIESPNTITTYSGIILAWFNGTECGLIKC